MYVDVTAEPGDYDALGDYLRARAEENRRRRIRYVAVRSVVVLAFVTGALAMIRGGGLTPDVLPIIGLYVGLMAVYLAVLFFWTASSARRRVAEIVESEKRKPSPPRRYSITEEGVTLREDARQDVAPWNTVADVVETEGHIFVFGDRAFPGVIPKRSFATDAEARQFYRLAREYWMKSAGPGR